ncbi:MAG: thioesterase family protein [Gammaproteobacteria bacterium]|nr:thioesterase family protein [Gammaproteobacteria bacterium]
MTLASLPADGIVRLEVTVKPEWLDYNDHMNVAWYVAAFDLGIDAFKDVIGITLDYIAREQRSTVALESHITYQREAHRDQVLRVETRIVDFDGKRVHIYQELYRDTDLLATQETVSISFDTAARRSCPFADDMAARYRTVLEAAAALPRPQWLGRSVGIRQGKPAA